MNSATLQYFMAADAARVPNDWCYIPVYDKTTPVARAFRSNFSQAKRRTPRQPEVNSAQWVERKERDRVRA